MGDFHRYFAEFSLNDNQKQEGTDKALAAYLLANEWTKKLPVYHYDRSVNGQFPQNFTQTLIRMPNTLVPLENLLLQSMALGMGRPPKRGRSIIL